MIPANEKGSISAEHGVGVMKPNHLHYSKSPEMIAVMQAIKRTLDPNGIMNPYKVLPDASAAQQHA
jgi:FAD/FMN-containing dehydrogenase